MKKIICLSLLALAMLITLLSVGTLSASAATEGYYTYTVSNSGATITDVSGWISGDITIPSRLGGYPVTSIGDSAFYYYSSVTSITIPDSVTSIGNSAFSNCSSLTDIAIPNGVTSIGNSAFYNCSSLTDIAIPNGVTSIGDSAFYNCYSLTSITIPNSVTSIGGGAFFFCDNLTSITVEHGNTVYHSAGNCLIETASKTLIAGCKSSVIPADGSVTNIGGAAFSNCRSLESITIPDSVTSIGHSAFMCSGLKNITILGGVERIETSAFASCALESIIIPDSVISIGNTAFHECFELATITFGENSQLTSIGNNVFYGCGFTSFTIPDNVTSIGDRAFDSCVSLTSITIPDSVTSIGKEAFSGCGSLTSITIESPTTEIYDDAYTISDTATIYGYEGSTAQAYAEKYNRTFVNFGHYGIECTLNADGESYTMTGYTGADTAIVVPTENAGLPITHFAEFDFPIVEDDNEIVYPGSGAIVTPEDSFNKQTYVKQITFLSKTIVIEDDAQTIPKSVTICGYVGSTAHQYALKYGRAFVILPEIVSANIALGSDITVNYLAYLDDSQKDAVMKFTVNGVTTTVQGVATATPNRYQYSFTGINPQMMGDNIAVELVLNGETLAAKGAYSVKQYCVNMKSRVASKSIAGFSDAQYAALDTLLADILEYGAAAQTYKGYNTSALVNAGITGASEFIPLTSAHKMPAFNASTLPDDASFTSAKVVLSNAIYLRFEFKTTDVSRVTIKVGDRVYDQDDFKFVSSQSDGFGIPTEIHALDSDAIFADQMEVSFTIILLVDGVECQRLQYSVVNYIYNMQNTTSDPNLVALLKRIRNYGLSAVAFKDAK